jgi:riboflavin synthase
MFTGIIEATGKVKGLNREGSNLHLDIESSIAQELKIDQSIAHNGVCLTVVAFPDAHTYRVTAIDETLQRTNLGTLSIGSLVNLERCMRLGDRLDGHMVQGHVDTTATLTKIEDLDGSWNLYFKYAASAGHITVEKGSICINGISLTVVESGADHFSVSIIPYTWEHTNLHRLQVGDKVNLEFDILGKYIAKLLGK